MDEIEFEWDPQKALVNRMKHGVAFEEAATVFEDDNALLLADPEHSVGEERMILLGRSSAGRVLVVVHCEVEREAVIRLISARAATRIEEHHYVARGPR